jgi:hypothetical protein
MRHLLALVTALAVAGPALACINYGESVNHEREFRSQYQESQYAPPEPVTVSSARPYLIGGTGALLALGGAFVLYRGRTQS